MTIGRIIGGIAILLLLCIAGAFSFGIVGGLIGPLIGVAIFFAAVKALRSTGAMDDLEERSIAVEETRFRSTPEAPPPERERLGR